MTQYDAAATPMWRCFQPKPNGYTFRAKPLFIDLNEKNVAVNGWQRLSETFNFAKEDSAPDDAFNRVLWYAVKGEHSVYPSPRRAAFLRTGIKKKDDDD